MGRRAVRPRGAAQEAQQGGPLRSGLQCPLCLYRQPVLGLLESPAGGREEPLRLVQALLNLVLQLAVLLSHRFFLAESRLRELKLLTLGVQLRLVIDSLALQLVPEEVSVLFHGLQPEKHAAFGLLDAPAVAVNAGDLEARPEVLNGLRVALFIYHQLVLRVLKSHTHAELGLVSKRQLLSHVLQFGGQDQHPILKIRSPLRGRSRRQLHLHLYHLGLLLCVDFFCDHFQPLHLVLVGDGFFTECDHLLLQPIDLGGVLRILGCFLVFQVLVPSLSIG
mmetsp:Transcript_93260/g.301652  ORF Transcript_93260/g.301652 Transcript_93260/m.301652 type:complete len:278 (+) Transcript_93260:737-1570(+)